MSDCCRKLELGKTAALLNHCLKFNFRSHSFVFCTHSIKLAGNVIQLTVHRKVLKHSQFLVLFYA